MQSFTEQAAAAKSTPTPTLSHNTDINRTIKDMALGGCMIGIPLCLYIVNKISKN